jgi:hypothetical protein
MILKLLPVGLMVCGIAFATQTAGAQGGSGCQSNAPTGPEPSNWHGPTSYQPGPAQGPMAPSPAPQAPGTNRQMNQPMNQRPAQGAMNEQQAPLQQQAPAQGQTAQDNQQYQSFSAEPQAVPMNSYAPNTYSYPTYGGYYGNPYYGGTYYGYPSHNSGWGSQFDNARFHGTNPNAYP